MRPSDGAETWMNGIRTSNYASRVFDAYFFEKNVQGDIIGVYNSTGKKIGAYTYDAWGKCSLSGANGNTILEDKVVAFYNPFRYRGYYYDVETGLYYLQSRYYNPEWGRFLNADGYVSTGTGMLGYNMFAYCNNNPVMLVDSEGTGPVLFVLIIVCSVVMFTSAALLPTSSEIKNDAERHYSRNERNAVNDSIDDIIKNYTKVEEWADQYHENENGLQGAEARYNDKYLSPNGGHYEIIICSPPNKSPYIVDESVDPINMGTYNYASNQSPFYYIDHFLRDMMPYYAFGNTKDDNVGFLKWAFIN